MSQPSRSTMCPLKYHGGKYLLAPWIVSSFPEHTRYVEPFGGAASVLLAKPRAREEVYNDLFGEVVNFFRVLRDEKSRIRLAESVTLTPFARAEYETAQEPSDDPVESARRLVVRASFCFGGKGATKKNGFRMSAKDRIGRWPGDLPEVLIRAGERFYGVLIENIDAFDLIAREDAPETLFYLDPPYAPSARNSAKDYQNEMTADDHARLLELLLSLLGMAALSGYDCDAYAPLKGWKKVSRKVQASGQSGSVGRVETLWLSPSLVERRRAGLF